MTDKILVGVDAAWRRSGAVDWALYEAVRRRMALRAVHVVDERLGHAYAPPVRLDGDVIVPAPIPQPDRRVVDEVEQYLVAADGTLDIDTDVLIGAPDRRLAELSAQAAITVVGRRGVGGFTRLLIGSTSEFVANHGDGPVVVVPNGWRRDLHAHAPVIVGLDGYEENDAALRFAFEMAELHGTRLWTVLAWDVPAPYGWNAATAAGMRDDWKYLAQDRLDSVAEQWRQKYPDVPVEQTLRQSHAAVALLDAVESTDAQLIVIGGRHHRGPGLILGSVARGVLHHATIPTAVVHERRSPA